MTTRTRCAARGGLSPLARGTQFATASDMWEERFIPAGAGNSHPRVMVGCVRAVYPRWRGELPVARVVTHRQAGLSPLARGTHHRQHRWIYQTRFIPAGAGNSVTPGGRLAQSPVYPRWRGELYFRLPTSKNVSGLSPLARGTLVYCSLQIRNSRFIPAGAGNS